MVRCGACRTEFEAPGEGRHPCPSCGAVNQVTGDPAGAAPSFAQPAPAPPEPLVPGVGAKVPEPAEPLPRVTCDSCSFEFVVGDIEVASCPNCSAEVSL